MASVSFDQPWYLLFLLLVPAIWLLGRRSFSGLATWQTIAAAVLRTIVLVLLVLALAQMQWVHTSDRLTVLYLLDQSASIPEPQRQAMTELVNESIARHRDARRHDRAGVIAFAREAALEYPPVDENIRLSGQVESRLDKNFTNLEAALKLAMAVYPGDSANRAVVLTDGNENLGDAMDAARKLSERGVGIDVVPVRYEPRRAIAVDKLMVPSEVQLGQPFDLRIVLDNTGPDSPQAAPVKGHLRVYRKTRETETELAQLPVELTPGKRVFTLHEQIDKPDFYTYTARFVPDGDTGGDQRMPDEASGFTQVRGPGRVLLIENSTDAGAHQLLIDQLRKEKLQVTVINTDELFTSLGQLQPFDTVILANVPREAFSDNQMKILAGATQHLGTGLIMLGGPNSFGAGGWANTPIEQALPVDCEIKNTKIRPAGALALVIDRSGSMSGEKLSLAKAAAAAAADILADNDYLTVTAFDALPHLIVPLVKKGDSQSIKSRIARLGTDGGTNMEPGILMAEEQIAQATEAGARHMVILTDGRTEGTNYPELIASLRRKRITVSTVAVGPDADVQLLQELARVGGGRFHQALSPQRLPRIFQQEARVVSQPLIFEKTAGFQPQSNFPHEILKGIDGLPPPIKGFVQTTLKSNPLVEVAWIAPVGAAPENRTLLASWTYGLGRVVAFTSDDGARWASDWSNWPDYGKLFSQMVRWSMRPSGEQGKFSIATDVRGDKVRVVVNALDAEDHFLNFLNFTAGLIGSDMSINDFQLRQTAPGRYTGEFDAPHAGSYLITLTPAAGVAPIVAGIDIPRSAESELTASEEMLTALAGLTPAGGEPGKIIEGLGHTPVAQLADVDLFRETLRPATSRQDAWPQLLLVAACLFFCDVLVRRVRLGFGARAYSARNSTAGRSAARRSSEPQPAWPTSAELVQSMTQTATKPAEQPQAETYTGRLLKAKQRVWNERRDS